MDRPALDKLSERERALLLLLAQGHTVKSAITITGDTEYAASELLRSARQKLGVSSSREAARLLDQTHTQPAPQKNWDENSKVASQPKSSAKTWSLIAGGLMLTSIIVVPVVFLITNKSSGEANAEPQPDRPKVVATYPEDGSVISAGTFELKVTYDRPMARGSMSFATGPEPAFPECKRPAKQSDDGKTFTLQCEAKAGERYSVWFNYGRYMNFRSGEDGRSAIPHGISFTVKN